MFVLDTDTLSDLFRGHEKILARLSAVPDNRVVATSVISRIEVLEGRFASIKKAANRDELLIAVERLDAAEQRLDSLDVLPITKAVADQFEKHRVNKKLKKIGRADLLIACVALANDATLVTRNIRDFANIPGLKVENWSS
jgi:tRNA(fMet)-specific endonuclease VapC